MLRGPAQSNESTWRGRMAQPTIVEFDLDRYLPNSKKVDLSGIDWDAIPHHSRPTR